MQKVILAIIGLVVGLMMAASILPGVVDEAASTAYADTFNTGVVGATHTVTLSSDHYYGDTRNLSATSDNVNDTVVILAYRANTKEVDVSGLEAAGTRHLTINYYKEAHQQYTGFSSFLRLTPFLAVVGLVVAALWGLFSHYKRE
jgi:hypothetical protein